MMFQLQALVARLFPYVLPLVAVREWERAMTDMRRHVAAPATGDSRRRAQRGIGY